MKLSASQEMTSHHEESFIFFSRLYLEKEGRAGALRNIPSSSTKITISRVWSRERKTGQVETKWRIPGPIEYQIVEWYEYEGEWKG
jgi:hypothetical protein